MCICCIAFCVLQRGEKRLELNIRTRSDHNQSSKSRLDDYLNIVPGCTAGEVMLSEHSPDVIPETAIKPSYHTSYSCSSSIPKVESDVRSFMHREFVALEEKQGCMEASGPPSCSVRKLSEDYTTRRPPMSRHSIGLPQEVFIGRSLGHDFEPRSGTTSKHCAMLAKDRDWCVLLRHCANLH